MSVATALARKVVRDQAITACVHLCNGLDPRRDGGMVPSILGMTAALAATVGPVRIVTPTPSQTNLFATPTGVTIEGPGTCLETAVRSASVVHLHGLWQGHTRRGARAARRAGVPYLIAAHGMAEPWAMRHKALKKRIYTALIEGNNLRKAACLHALSRPEVDHLRAVAPKTPVALIPNGVDLAPFHQLPDRYAIEQSHPELAGKFVVLFFGRLHTKKGLDLLAPALAAVGRDHPDLHILLAGIDDGAWIPFQKQTESLGVARRVTYLGHLAGQEAQRAWARADAFVLPSYSEGFSMAILEAMACRLPVLATHSCHFPELEGQGGILTHATREGVETGLRNLVEMSASDRAEMGRKGRALVESQYTWAEQARRLGMVYQWVRGEASRPDFVM